MYLQLVWFIIPEGDQMETLAFRGTMDFEGDSTASR
ncbi:MAG: hypothetical protein RLZZ214_1433 [Verrucomicrobiota bacterium]|jgi:hypothetical protein